MVAVVGLRIKTGLNRENEIRNMLARVLLYLLILHLHLRNERMNFLFKVNFENIFRIDSQNEYHNLIPSLVLLIELFIHSII